MGFKMLERGDFNHLPIEVLLEIGGYLSPETLTKTSGVNRAFRFLAQNNSLWKEKFKRHFPHIAVLITKDTQWYAEFCKAYQAEYKNLPSNLRKLFSRVKEGEVTYLDNIFELVTVEQLGQNIYLLLNWANHQHNQNVFDRLYQEVRKKYQSGLTLNVAQADNDGRTILYWAIKCHQSVETIDLIIQHGANIHAALTRGATPLYLAAQEGHSNGVKLLLAKQANVNATYTNGATPLFIAAQNGHTKVLQLLLAAQANVNATLTDGTTALYIAAQEGRSEVVKLLLAAQADANAAPAVGATALYIAAQEGHAEVVKLLLAAPAANVNAACKDGSTPLHVAVHQGHLEVVKLLLAADVNLNAARIDGTTALHIARQKGYAAISRAINQKKLTNYLEKVNLRSDDHYRTAYRLFGGHTFHFGFSAKEKKAAALALKNVIFHGADKASLATHQGALNNGELQSIYKSLKPCR